MQNLDKIKELAETLPDAVKENALNLVERMGSVIEGIGDTPIAWRPDIARILQGTSDRSKLPKSVAIGSIVVGEDILEQPVRLIPIRMWDGRQAWSPDQNEAKIICSSPDAVVGYIGYYCKECPKAVWEDGKSECSKIKQVAVITEDLSKFFIVNFSKTGFAIGNEWAGLMKKAGVSPFKRIYEFKTETHKQYKNVEAPVVLAPANNKTPEAYYAFLQALYSQFDADRTEHLKSFHEIALRRGAANAALTYQNAEQPALTDGTVTVETPVESETQTKLASKYEM
jgi:hypothetical protein